ncbi:MAG: hypothetical protein QW267_06655 [Sulfolobales archaeon]
MSEEKDKWGKYRDIALIGLLGAVLYLLYKKAVEGGALPSIPEVGITLPTPAPQPPEVTKVVLVREDTNTISCYFVTDTSGKNVIKEYPPTTDGWNQCVRDMSAMYQEIAQQYIQQPPPAPAPTYPPYQEAIPKPPTPPPPNWCLVRYDDQLSCYQGTAGFLVGTVIACFETAEGCYNALTHELSKQGVTQTLTPALATSVTPAVKPEAQLTPETPVTTSGVTYQQYVETLTKASQNEACFDECRKLSRQCMEACQQLCCTPTSWGGFACESDCWERCRQECINKYYECISRC